MWPGILWGRSSTYPESHNTKGTDSTSHIVMAAEGVCTHPFAPPFLPPPLPPPLPPRDDGDGDLDVPVGSGVLKSRGWCRVETMIILDSAFPFLFGIVVLLVNSPGSDQIRSGASG